MRRLACAGLSGPRSTSPQGPKWLVKTEIGLSTIDHTHPESVHLRTPSTCVLSPRLHQHRDHCPMQSPYIDLTTDKAYKS